MKNFRRTGLFFLAPAVIAAVSSAAPTRDQATATPAVGGADFEGSTILSLLPPGFQPGIIYKKYPTEESVGPGEVWQLGVGVVLPSAAPSISATLSLDPGQSNADIQILDDDGTLALEQGLYHNYDPAERFEIQYTGTLDPFVGPIEFLIEPDGFDAVPVLVHLNVTDQPGFPVPLLPLFSSASPFGDIIGDGTMAILVPGEVGGALGLHAFDDAGNALSGWPFRLDDPDIVSQSFAAPAIADLDGDGPAEIAVTVFMLRDAQGEGLSRGFVPTTKLFVIDGSGQVRWESGGNLDESGIAAVADLDGDTDLDVVVPASGNLIRFEADGTPLMGWQVETLNDIHVDIPVLADVDGNPVNGLEIVACTPVFGMPSSSQVYVWNQDGALHAPNWPKEMPKCNTPTVLDLDGNPGNGLEIVMAVDHDEDPPVDPDTGFLNTFSVFAWHADGSDVTGWPYHFFREPNIGLVDDRLPSPCSAGDVDGDGDMEIVVGTYGQGDPANGNLFLFHHNGTLDANWPQWAGIAQTPAVWGGPALGDLDGDGRLEIVTASLRGVYVFRDDGSMFEGFPKLTADVFAQPMIGDIDNDGHVEIAAVALNDRLYVWRMAMPSTDPQLWPQFRQNTRHTGTHQLNPARAAIPSATGLGLAIMVFLVVCTGAFVIRRNVRQTN